MKMNSSVVISGEASETDSEDEVKHKMENMATSVQGAVITGEDSESENENEGSICSAVSALNDSSSVNDLKEEKYNTLLHQKLKESNMQLHNDLEMYSQNMIDDAGKKLNSIDQQLLRSQLTLQNAVTSLKSMASNTFSLKTKLHSILSAKFISNIQMPK